MLRATAERRLKLAAKILAIRMSQQKLRQRPRVWRHVKSLILAHAGIRASSHVAHRIPASLASGNICRRQSPHQRRSVVNLNVMQLEILARGHMCDAVGVLFRQLSHDLELPCIQPARGNLNALHPRRIPHGVGALGQRPRRKIELLDFLPIAALTIVIALPVGPSPQPGFGEEALVQLALLTQCNVSLKSVNFARQTFRQLPGELFFPKCVRRFHKFSVEL